MNGLTLRIIYTGQGRARLAGRAVAFSAGWIYLRLDSAGRTRTAIMDLLGLPR
jgi:hypothetical protein